MRTLKNLNYPQDPNITEFPDGQIVNETLTQDGTPVTRELYGDVLVNIYKVLRDAGIDANELEDNETRGYQFLQALKLFANDLNDLEQILTITSSGIQCNFNIDNLPLNYLFIGRNSDIIQPGVNYIFSGTGTKTLTFSTQKEIKANSLIIVTLKGTTVLINTIPESSNAPDNFILTPFSGVLSYNSTETTYYLSDGYLINNTPISSNIQQAIRLYESDATIVVSDAVIHKGKLFVMAKSINLNIYDFYVFDLNSLGTVLLKLSYAQSGTDDFNPYLYSDADNIYLTNNGNNSTSDNIIDKIIIDYTAETMSKVSEMTLSTSFGKTSNAFLKNGDIYTYINGTLNVYKSDGTVEFLLFLNNINGQLFKQADKIYFTSGEIATVWNV